MRKTFILRLANPIKYAVLLIALLTVAGISNSHAQVSFSRGASQTLTVCENTSGIGIDSFLAITDPTAGLTESWSVATAPAHGSLSLSTFVASSTGSTVTPTGWAYSPTGGYSGSDSFTIVVNNGTISDTTVVVVTVNPAPTVGAITGITTQCVTGSQTLSNATTGGVWFSTDPSIASINSTSGVVRGISTGITSIVYTVTNIFGCQNAAFAADTVITIPTVAATTGSSSVCVGFTTTLSNTTPSGTWSTASGAIASVNASGLVFGNSVGSTNIIYTVSNICGINSATFPITVNPSSISPITPASAVSVCIGATTTLSNATSGGVWSSATPSVATVNTTGVVTGVATGTATIVYTITNSCGVINQFKTVDVITVPALPPAIGGPSSICLSTSATLTNTTTGGVWSSSNPTVATINPTTGDVFGGSIGSATIFYTVTNTCGSTSQSLAIAVVTAPPTPAAITGTTSICVGATSTLSNTTTGGVWSTSNASIASIDSATGVMSGVSSGSTTVSYTVVSSCGATSRITAVSVSTPPAAPAAIAGTLAVCVGGNTTLTNATSGGVWSSLAPSIASINTGGVVTGVSAGVTTISYTVTNFCGSTAATAGITVSGPPAAPDAITGPSTVCVGANITLASTTSGGNWSSANPTVASVTSTGDVRGNATGTVNISYTVVGSCGATSALYAVSVTTVPAVLPITGTINICNGASSTLSNVTGGGTWSSVTASVATINSTGFVTGLSAGTSLISYTVSNSCGSNAATTTITVTDPPATPSAITGTTTVCVGATTALSTTTTGGVWTSTAPAIGSITSGGIARGNSVGTATISYTVSNFCGSAAATTTLNVITTPTVAVTFGAATVCLGDSTTLTNSTSGGVWSTASAITASVNSTGVVYGISTGSTNISYTVTNICGSTSRLRGITVNTIPGVPAAITSAATVCVGASITATSATVGGSWSSSDVSIASVNASTGSVSGVSGGTFTLTYTVTNTCGSNFTTRSITVNTPPVIAAIAGATEVCVGSNTTLTNATSGGVWSSVNPTIASITSGGVVRGNSTGTATISYTASNICGTSAATRSISVITTPTAPAVITGATTVCAGSTITLSSATTGGVWSSTATSIATVDTTGVVTGLSAGTATISYSMINSCGIIARTRTITVGTAPSVAAIGGTSTVCIGSATTLTNTTPSGTWGTSNAAIASVNIAGTVTGVSAGTATISYSVTSACGTTSSTRTVTVNTVPAAPAAITGTLTACIGLSTSLTSVTAGGAWSTADPTIATVNSVGLVTGISAGIATISYTSTNACGSTSTTASFTVTTVPPIPAVIGGPSSVCTGSTVTLTNDTLGGVWSSTSPTFASISSTGVVSGLTVGTSTISYTIANSCGSTARTMVISVITIPFPAAIGGTPTVCAGSTTTLTNSTSGGVWSSANPSIASVNTSGVVTGVTPDSSTVITYTVTNACGANSATRTVNVITTRPVGAITGPTLVCVGANITLADTSIGGTWSSATPTLATVDAAGVVTGISSGTATISYTVFNGCGANAATYAVTVSAPPVVAPITGPTIHCVGSTVTLSSTTTGGTWFSINTAVATVNSAGVVTAVSAGTSTIVYSVTNSCGTSIRTVIDTVNSGTVDTIVGASAVCLGSSTTFTNASTGGTWTTSNFTIASVNATTGVVSGVSLGTANITYSVTNTCGTNTTARSVTVEDSYVAGISGPADVCVGSSITLTDSTVGGTWATSNAAIASVDPSTGVVTGVTANDSAVIVYTFTNSCGSFNRFLTVRVREIPVISAISGSSTLCLTTSTTLATTTTGGVWTSSNPLVATIDGSGNVTGINSGTADITYTVTSIFGCTNFDTFTITVSPLPNAGIITSATVCEGGSTTFTSTVTGGSWSTSDASIASVDAATGAVSGITPGTVTIQYLIIEPCGSDSTSVSVTVNPRPISGSISGLDSVCEASSITLTASLTGGSWSTSDATIASVDGAGVVSGVAFGAATITYSTTTICGTADSTFNITVNPLPIAGTITGADSICLGASTTLSSSVALGVWSTSNAAIATIDTVSGFVTGLDTGMVTISYSYTNTCGTDVSTRALVIQPLPFAGAITGIDTFCEGSSSILVSSVSGGSWSTTDLAIASVDASTGEVFGLAAGIATISYTLTTPCGTDDTSMIVTIRPLPRAGTLSGTDSVCVNSTVTFASTTTGGSWSISDLTVASVNATTGTVTGITAGTATVSYIYINGCGSDTVTTGVRVLPLPFAGTISGPAVVCEGSNITLSSTVSGGTWSTASATTASVNASTGVVTGVVAGTVNISYTYTNSCGTHDTFTLITVTPLPDAGIVSGTLSVCIGDSTLLTSTVSGGSWTSETPTTATVSGTGGVFGIAAGTVNISYSFTNSCGTDHVVTSVTVNPLPFAGTITGASSVCVGSSITLSNTTSFGTGSWSVSSSIPASVSATGVVTGTAAGTAIITYVASTATCGTDTTTTSITVIPVLTAGTISGPTGVCVGNSISLTTSGSAGGTWTTASAAIASVNTTGDVTGVGGGTTDITYTVSNSCGTFFTVHTVTVTPVPTAGAITGSSPICVGSTTVFVASGTGGTGVWSTTNATIASVNSSTGAVTGVAAGTANISFTVTNACGTASSGYSVVVNPLPVTGTITGTFTLCVGDTTRLRNTATGGTWSSSATGVASINPTTGLVYGSGSGTTTISYTVSNSCGTLSATASLTVNALPNAGTISGASSVCVASSITLTSSGDAGGAWSSSATSVAGVISSTGVVTGVGAGTATISYIVSTATCGRDTATRTVTVNRLPNAGTISGPSTVCTGSTITLVDTFGGGTGSWTTASPSIATVSSTGVVLGRSAGTAIITYAVTTASCGSDSAFATVSVLSTPSAGTIAVPSSVCQGASITVTTSGTSGGTWTTSVAGIASINPTTGVVFGVSGGTTSITYTVSSASCGTYFSVASVTVIPTPDPGTIIGATGVCVGSALVLRDTFASGAGSWSISPTTIASVNTTGVVRGISAGTAIVSYSVTNACGTRTDTMMITVYPLPVGGTITGRRSVCVGANDTLANATATSGGIWTTTSTNAIVDISSGILTGISAGTAVITYTVNSPFCGSASDTFTVTILALPDPGVISGTTDLCVGASTTLTSSVSGGAWTIVPSTYASISSAGVVLGISAGTSTVSYTVTSARCGSVSATTSVTINPLPNPGTITGGPVVCVGSSVALATTGTTGGAWSMPTSSFATIDASGNISGLSAGTVVVTYTVSTPTCGSDFDTALITINALPTAGTISLTSGTIPFCEGTTVTLTGSVSGGSWSTTDVSTASVSSAGVVTGTGGGSTSIVYTITSAFCGSATTTYTVSVDPLPSVGAISGPSSICLNDSSFLSNATAGGVWTSSNTSIASIDSTTGLVYALRVGSATISYRVVNACGSRTVTFPITINPLPDAGTITGFSSVCVGTTTLAGTTGTGGGSWSTTSSNISISGSGVVLGISAGSATITYTVTTATCGSAFAVRNMTVIAIPVADTITGPGFVCEASSITLANATAGGMWESSNSSIAAVNALGQVTGITVGSVTITYTVMNVCGADTAYAGVRVDPLPEAGVITGTSSLCIGVPSAISTTVSGGTWSSSTPSVASISAAGDVYGLAPGNDTIIYTVTNSCGTDTAVKVITVNSLPDAGTITGLNRLCQGDSTILTNTVSTGYWTSSNAAIAAAYFSGKVVGVSAGTVIISYTVTNYCGTDVDTMLLTVRPPGHCGPDAVEDVTANVNDITVYPNPAINVLHIKTELDIHVAVISPDGKTVINQKNNKDIDVSNLASGVYMIMIYDEKDSLLKATRFIKAD